MTPEEALLILLSDTVETYEHLKKAKPLDDGNVVHPMYIVVAAAQDMGWDIMIENENASKEVRGISIGTEEYFKGLLNLDKKLDELYNEIKHGDDAHQQWLKEKFEDFKKKHSNE